MNIAFIGYFAPKKGSRLLRPLIESCFAADKVYIFGHIGDVAEFAQIKHKIVFHTKYENAELRSLLERHNIDLGLVLSTWAETFSMTFFEALHVGVPVITNDIGFPFHKLKHEGGDQLFFDSKKPIQSIEQLVKKFRRNPEKYKQQAVSLAQKYASEIKLSADLKYQIIDDLLGKANL